MVMCNVFTIVTVCVRKRNDDDCMFLFFTVLRTRDVLRKAKTNLQVSSLVASY